MKIRVKLEVLKAKFDLEAGHYAKSSLTTFAVQPYVHAYILLSDQFHNYRKPCVQTLAAHRISA